MNFEELSPEMQEKVRACKTPEEIQALALEAGYELSEEDLDQIAGGSALWGPWKCETNDGCPRWRPF